MMALACVLCGKRTATYVCRDCGRTVCNDCFDPIHWSCSECQTRLRPSAAAGYAPSSQFSVATWLFFAAFAMIFIGILLMTVGSLSSLNPNNVSSGVVILVGPIPIILGAGQYSFALVGLAILLTIFVLVFFLYRRKKT